MLFWLLCVRAFRLNVLTESIKSIFVLLNMCTWYERLLLDFILNMENLYFATCHVWQIQVKTEGNTPISKFFSRKVAEGEDTKLEHKTLCPESVKTEQTKEDLTEEAKTEEGESDMKFSGSPPSQNVTKLPIKREYEAISSDLKPSLANNDKSSANPAKKKEKADDKQPTLFSYFGKR